MTMRPNPTTDRVNLSRMPERELRRIELDASRIALSLRGVRRLFEGLANQVRSARASARPGTADQVELELTDLPVGNPMDVVLDQRDAMARSVELRDDPERSEAERRVWAIVVERLAVARRRAKRVLADRRRQDPSEETWMDAQFQAAVLERRAGTAAIDPRAANAAANGAASGDVATPAGRPAPWQPAHDRVGSETGPGTTPMGPAETEQLVSGPGLAGGTGGTGATNIPADTGVRPETPPLAAKDTDEPPDVADRG